MAKRKKKEYFTNLMNRSLDVLHKTDDWSEQLYPTHAELDFKPTPSFTSGSRPTKVKSVFLVTYISSLRFKILEKSQTFLYHTSNFPHQSINSISLSFDRSGGSLFWIHSIILSPIFWTEQRCRFGRQMMILGRQIKLVML